MSKKTVKIIMALIAAALVAILIIGANFSPHKTERQRIGTAAIRVLEKYADGEMDSEFAAKTIATFMDKAKEAQENETDQAEIQKLTALWLDLMYIYTPLSMDGWASTDEIDETIQRIKIHL